MSQDQMLRDILEMVTFIKDNAATHEDLRGTDKGLRDEMRQMDKGIRDEMRQMERRLDQRIDGVEHKIEAVSTEVSRAKSELFEHIDHFITLHQKLEIELTSMRAKYDRLEELVYRMAKQLNIEVPV